MDKWLTEEFPGIVKRIAEEKAEIFFGKDNVNTGKLIDLISSSDLSEKAEKGISDSR